MERLTPLWQVALVSILPGLIWLMIFRRQDTYEPEPKLFLLGLFGLGILSVLPAFFLELPWRDRILFYLRTESLGRLALLNFLPVAVVEELAKLAALYPVVIRSREYNEPLDGIIYGVTVGLGFAACENLLYAFSYGPTVGVLRALVTSLAHASFSGWLGYFLSLVKFGRRRIWLLVGLSLAILLHGSYNTMLLAGEGGLKLMSLALVAAAIIALLKKTGDLARISPFRTRGDR